MKNKLKVLMQYLGNFLAVLLFGSPFIYGTYYIAYGVGIYYDSSIFTLVVWILLVLLLMWLSWKEYNK